MDLPARDRTGRGVEELVRQADQPRVPARDARVAVGVHKARVRPTISIWYHQHARLVDPEGDARIARRYARLVGLPSKVLYSAPGSITRWQVHTYPSSTGLVVELPPGSLSAAAARRHADAVLTVAGEAA